MPINRRAFIVSTAPQCYCRASRMRRRYRCDRPRIADAGESRARVSRRAAGRDSALYARARSVAWLAARQPSGGMRLYAAGRLHAAEVGRITGRGNTANLESVIALKPDLILDVGSTSATFVSLAERVQQQTGIPYALLDGRFDASRRDLPQARRADRAARAMPKSWRAMPTTRSRPPPAVSQPIAPARAARLLRARARAGW